MVQFVFTPWESRRSLLEVRRQFYPEQVAASPSTVASSSLADNINRTATLDADEARRRTAEAEHAVSRVSMWMQRGGCPHMVESTALLAAAVLSDGASSSSSYAVRAAYSAAFSRFVTGLLDSHQDKQRKLSMYSVAKTIGLPATFVELRHQATHEQLPSLTKLRVAARAALAWIWDYYWRHLAAHDDALHGGQDGGEGGAAGDGEGAAAGRQRRECRVVLMRCLEAGGDGGDEALRPALLRRMRTWGAETVLLVLNGIGDEALASGDQKMVLRTVRLSREVAAWDTEAPGQGEAADPGERLRDLHLLREEVARSKEELLRFEEQQRESRERPEASGGAASPAEKGPGWTRYEGWEKKPIGCL